MAGHPSTAQKSPRPGIVTQPLRSKKVTKPGGLRSKKVTQDDDDGLGLDNKYVPLPPLGSLWINPQRERRKVNKNLGGKISTSQYQPFPIPTGDSNLAPLATFDSQDSRTRKKNPKATSKIQRRQIRQVKKREKTKQTTGIYLGFYFTPKGKIYKIIDNKNTEFTIVWIQEISTLTTTYCQRIQVSELPLPLHRIFVTQATKIDGLEISREKCQETVNQEKENWQVLLNCAACTQNFDLWFQKYNREEQNWQIINLMGHWYSKDEFQRTSNELIALFEDVPEEILFKLVCATAQERKETDFDTDKIFVLSHNWDICSRFLQKMLTQQVQSKFPTASHRPVSWQFWNPILKLLRAPKLEENGLANNQSLVADSKSISKELKMQEQDILDLLQGRRVGKRIDLYFQQILYRKPLNFLPTSKIVQNKMLTTFFLDESLSLEIFQALNADDQQNLRNACNKLWKNWIEITKDKKTTNLESIAYLIPLDSLELSMENMFFVTNFKKKKTLIVPFFQNSTDPQNQSSERKIRSRCHRFFMFLSEFLKKATPLYWTSKNQVEEEKQLLKVIEIWIAKKKYKNTGEETKEVRENFLWFPMSAKDWPTPENAKVLAFFLSIVSVFSTYWKSAFLLQNRLWLQEKDMLGFRTFLLNSFRSE